VTYLGERKNQGAVISADSTNPFGNGFWKVEFTPEIFAFGANDFEIYHIFLTGPASSHFVVYINTRPYSIAVRGDANEYDPKWPIAMRGGQSLIFYFDSAATPKPIIWVSCRTPSL
jgi:hypothetical protein